MESKDKEISTKKISFDLPAEYYFEWLVILAIFDFTKLSKEDIFYLMCKSMIRYLRNE